MDSDTFQTIFGLLGGLAVFIYGMNLMSDGLQKAAGERMRTILGYLTKNPLVGVLAGAATTAVLQSSSATTVMAIGFVSAGLMSLPQAVSIILGANIGTTMTAQLIAFQIDDYVWPIVFVGFLFFFFGKREKVKYFGQTVFAFGLLFVGIATMGSVMKPLAASPVFAEVMMKVHDVPVLGVLLGVIMTVVVQSSSATIAVLQNMAAQTGPDGVSSIIGLTGALPILFGDNIGTTITALLAAVGGSTNAKRTAVAHTVFNLTGTVVFLFLIPQFAALITFISPSGPETLVIARQIANAHTAFNIINTLLWLPFIGLLVKIVTKLVKEKEVEQLRETDPVFLDYNVIERPVFAIYLATKELSRIAEMIPPMLEDAEEAFIKGSRKAIERIRNTEDNIDLLQDATVKYLSSLFASRELTEHQSATISGLLHVAADIEHMGDQCENVAEFAQAKLDNDYQFSGEALEEISSAFAEVRRMVKNTIRALKDGDEELAIEIIRQEEDVDQLEAQLRSRHLKRLEQGKCSPEFTVIYTDIIHIIEKISDYCKNIAEAVLEDVDFTHEGPPQ